MMNKRFDVIKREVGPDGKTIDGKIIATFHRRRNAENEKDRLNKLKGNTYIVQKKGTM